MFECCSAKYESYQTDCFATSYKSTLRICLFWRDFSKSQTRTVAILLRCPDTILHENCISPFLFSLGTPALRVPRCFALAQCMLLWSQWPQNLKMNFGQILWNKVFCRMFGLVVIEVMTLSGHLSNIDEMTSIWAHCTCTRDSNTGVFQFFQFNLQFHVLDTKFKRIKT